MHLIAPLAAGVAGAANGTATITRRSTGSAATLWSDFEARSQLASHVVTLNANGAAEVYADEVVDVVVADADGVTVAEFTSGEHDGAVEVISQAFTGTDYDDGSGPPATGTSKPTTLASVLDLWKTVNGSIDWKIDVAGSSKSIKDAVAGLAGIFFNVKDPAYGAKGDGATDDAAAIQAAIDAAQAAGGGIVFFPAGTYRITVALTWKEGVWLLGAGPGNSIIKQASTGINVFDVLAAGGAKSTADVMQGLTIGATAATSVAVIDAAAATSRTIEIRNCEIGDPQTNSYLIDHAGGTCRLRDVDLIMSAMGQTALRSTGRCEIYGGSVTPPSTVNSNTWVQVDDGIVSGVVFNNGNATSGTGYCIGPTGDTLIQGCLFRTSGGATIYPIYITTGIASGEIAIEAGNVFEGSGLKYLIGTGAGDRAQLYSRERDYATLESNANPVTIDALNFGTVWLKRTSTINFALDFPADPPLGARCTVLIENASGGTISSITGGTNAVTTQAGSQLLPSVPTGDVLAAEFVVGQVVSGTAKWYLHNFKLLDQ